MNNLSKNAPKNTQKSGVPLGTTAKSASSHEPRGIQSHPENSVIDFDPAAFRLEKFALQSVVRKLLPDSRTSKCLRWRQHSQDGIDVFRSIEHKTAHYGGLQTCGSVWVCPVCAFKISNRRSPEVLHAINSHKSNGGEVLLLTLTNPHTRGDDLLLMTKAQSKAMKYFTSGRATKVIWSDIGFIGSIRAWEITHGLANGWHPHFHILLFVNSGLDLKFLESKLYTQWANACRLAGLPIPSIQHGVKVDNGSMAAKYVSKWGLDQEVTKGHTKKAKNGGRSPFDLLRSYLYDDDKHAGSLFIEFVTSYKGKRQLYWSKGLKDRFGVDDITDKETAAVQDDAAELLGKIEIEEWKLVLKSNLRGEILELARHGWEPIRRLLDSLISK